MDALHVRPLKFPALAGNTTTMWEFNMQIMNLRAGNANVAPPSIAHEHSSFILISHLLYCVGFIFIVPYVQTSSFIKVIQRTLEVSDFR